MCPYRPVCRCHPASCRLVYPACRYHTVSGQWVKWVWSFPQLWAASYLLFHYLCRKLFPPSMSQVSQQIYWLINIHSRRECHSFIFDYKLCLNKKVNQLSLLFNLISRVYPKINNLIKTTNCYCTKNFKCFKLCVCAVIVFDSPRMEQGLPLTFGNLYTWRWSFDSETIVWDIPQQQHLVLYDKVFTILL